MRLNFIGKELVGKELKNNEKIHLTQRAQSVSQRAQRISLKIGKNATPQNGKKPRFHLIFPTKQPQ
jgi:hypothetical protein